MKNCAIYIAAVLLAGCATTATVPVDTSGLTAAIENGQAASEVEQAARTEEAKAREAHEEAARDLSAKLKANLVSADEALGDGRLALGHGEVRIADSRLPDVTPDPEEMRAAAERRRLDAEAKVEQLEQSIAAAMGEDAQVEAALAVCSQDLPNRRHNNDSRYSNWNRATHSRFYHRCAGYGAQPQARQGC